MKNKRGQVAIFVIVGMVLVVGILFLFMIRDRGIDAAISPEKNPEAFVEKCLKDAVEEAIDPIILQGGFIEPRDYKLYQGIKASYLCKHTGNFKPCINQHPMFLNDINRGISEYVKPRVENCLMTIKNEFEKRQYTVVLSDVAIDLDLSPGVVKPTMTSRVVLTRGEEVKSFSNIGVEVESPLYDLAKVAMDIANSESMFCYFEYVGYIASHPQFMIKKTTVSDSTRIYTIIDRESGKEMNIAIRGCVIPQGI